MIKFGEHSNYRIGLNATTVYNNVLLTSGKGLYTGRAGKRKFHNTNCIGHPIGSFYGYEIDGVYKTETQALLDPVYQAIKNKGFFKYKDQNGDKVINESDKVFLGSAIPMLLQGLILVPP